LFFFFFFAGKNDSFDTNTQGGIESVGGGLKKESFKKKGEKS